MKHPYFNQYKYTYLEWNDADSIHEITLLWQSQVEFIKTEQTFLAELLTDHTLQLLAETGFDFSKHLATELRDFQKEIPKLLERIQNHRNDLEVLVDKRDQFQAERAFQDAHLLLELKMGDYLEKYKLLKEEIFKTMKTIFAKSKEKQIPQK